KYTVVGGMDDESRRRKIAGDRKARADRILIHQKLVMIPSESGIHGPFANMDQVFDECRLLKIWAIPLKGKVRRRPGIKRIVRIVRIYGDRVTEILMQKHGIGFDARLPLLIAMMDGNRAIKVSLGEIVVEESANRPCGGVG